MKKISALLATGVVCVGTVAGWAAPAAASDYNRTVRICNYSNKNVDVAKVSDQPGGLASEGWYNWDNGECATLTGRWMRFESSTGGIWTFNGAWSTQFCVLSDAFTVYSPGSQQACNSVGGDMTTFYSVPPGNGTYNYTLRPVGG